MLNDIDYAVRCTDDACKDQIARYKIAAEWTGGGFTELKTYGFANDDCIERVLHNAYERTSKLLLSEGETLGDMRIYLMDTHRHDYELTRALDLEEKLLPKVKKQRAKI